jgi:hypothetical protein
MRLDSRVSDEEGSDHRAVHVGVLGSKHLRSPTVRRVHIQFQRRRQISKNVPSAIFRRRIIASRIGPGVTANLVALGIHALNDSGVAGFDIISVHICTVTINNKPRTILTSFTRYTFQ